MATRLIGPVGICYASVCSDEGPDAAVTWLNREVPTGISSRWKLSEDETFAGGEPNPCPCSDDASCLHYLCNC